ncbi:ATP-binding protein [Sphingobacterium sp. JB170]|uniref:ATP-binding protein n=1 Tax=Sphingobacterium sp. JB170 TaxID=1434842 RepID=UPI00097F3308|nr:ATP-binding protein [Sphingobacterium sp. JB170]SJN46521.1 Mobile element protein [Sphingobacterium sp. JB170]
MNNQSTLEQLSDLRLFGMAKCYQAMLNLPSHEQEDAYTLVGMLCQAEIEQRNFKRTERLLKNSKLRYNALLEEVICKSERGLSKEMLITLSDENLISRSQNVLIHGATGCGKSYLACALGRNACLLGYKVLYLAMNKFLEAIAQAKLDGTYLKWMRSIAAHPVIVLDDFGLKPLSHDAKIALLDILEDRYGNGSIIITSQLPLNKYYEFINEPYPPYELHI